MNEVGNGVGLRWGMRRKSWRKEEKIVERGREGRGRGSSKEGRVWEQRGERERKE